MENILVVIFDSAEQAEEGFSALNQLDCDGIIVIYAASLIRKDVQGTVSVQETQGNFAFHTIAGTALGSLIGLLGGLAGFGIGATVGGITGIIRDLRAAGVNSHFVDDIAAMMTPGKFALVADVSEGRIVPVDSRMEALGGFVFRTEKNNFENALRAQEITEIRARIDQLKEEQVMAVAGRKEEIQGQLNTLNQKLQVAQAEAEQRAEQIKREGEAKIQVLQEKAAKAHGEAKATIHARIDQLRKQYESSAAELRNATAIADLKKEEDVKQPKAG